MSGDQGKLDDFLGDILRGAAAILGCNSTTLVLINENTRELRVHIGVTSEDFPLVSALEQAAGTSFSYRVLPLPKAEDSVAYRAWRDREVHETSSFVELAGSAFAAGVAAQLDELVGARRFICVPAANGPRNYGVLVFEKAGRRRFSRQQREVLLRYARSIAELLESSLVGEGQTLLAQWRSPRAEASSLDDELLRITLGDPAPTVFVDTAGRVTSGNAAAERLFGWDAELRGRGFDELFRAGADVQDLLGQQVRDPLAPGREVTLTARRRTGTLFRANVKALALADARGRVAGFLVLVREERDDDAVTERPEVRDRFASVGEMAAQLAHEIRNPIVAIGATLESLSRDDEVGEEPRALLGSLGREIARLDMVLRGYMAGRLADPSFSEVRVAEVMEAARRLLDAGQRLSGKRIRLDIAPALVVRADPDALKQVFFNLLLNALEASPQGGEVVCRAAAGTHDVAISVEDRGHGLSAPAARCFQPFFTTKSNGTGLGLAVCQKLARSHGGLVELRNRPGGGCEALLVLPRHLSAAAGAAS